ncbi:hypothetical protein BCR44DRAFT_1430345 [Catenaria anguillulae PL171]|uniref:Transmembrane protein n=1 Tax=Catenaria anguillulae PL171 TaxID=765915 RepID=A0A1Y2HSE8_9FUNG|nr:hypothetical protein BCR44DRAFT_1430345 [Catenaria anguillulae PL171]
MYCPAVVASIVLAVVSVAVNAGVTANEDEFVKLSGSPRSALPSSWVLITVLVSSTACALSIAYAWAYHASRHPRKGQSTKPTIPTRSDSGLSIVSIENSGNIQQFGSFSHNVTVRRNSQSVLDVSELRALNLLPESPSLFTGLQSTSVGQRHRQSSASSTASNASDHDSFGDNGSNRVAATTPPQAPKQIILGPSVGSPNPSVKPISSSINSPIPTLLCAPPNTPNAHSSLRRYGAKTLPMLDVNELHVPQLLAEAVALDTDPAEAQRQWQSPQLQVLYVAWCKSLQHGSARAMWPVDWVPIAKPFLGGHARGNAGTWEVSTVHLYLEKKLGKSILQQIQQFVTESGSGSGTREPRSAARVVARSTCTLGRLRPIDHEFLVQFIEQYERAVFHVHPYASTGSIGSNAPDSINIATLWSAILDVGNAILALPSAHSYRALFSVEGQRQPADIRPRFKLALATQSRPMYSPIATRSPAQALLVDVILPLANLHGQPPTSALWERISGLAPEPSLLSKLAQDLWTSRNPMQAIRDAVTVAETSLVSLGVFCNPSQITVNQSGGSGALCDVGKFKYDDFGDQCYDSDLSSDECDQNDRGSGCDDESGSESDEASSRFVELRRKQVCECGTCSSCLLREAFEMAASKGRRREGRRRKPAREQAPSSGHAKWNVIESRKLQDALNELASSQTADSPTPSSSPMNSPSPRQQNTSVFRAVAAGLLSLAVDYVHSQIKSRLQMDGGDAVYDSDPDSCFASIPARGNHAAGPLPSSPWIPAQSTQSADKLPRFTQEPSFFGPQLRITQPKLHQQLLKRGSALRKGKSDKRIKPRVRGVQSWWEEDTLVL